MAESNRHMDDRQVARQLLGLLVLVFLGLIIFTYQNSLPAWVPALIVAIVAVPCLLCLDYMPVNVVHAGENGRTSGLAPNGMSKEESRCLHNAQAPLYNTSNATVTAPMLHDTIVKSMELLGVEFIIVEHASYQNHAECWLMMLHQLQILDTKQCRTRPSCATPSLPAPPLPMIPAASAVSSSSASPSAPIMDGKLQTHGSSPAVSSSVPTPGDMPSIPPWYKDSHDDRYRTEKWPNGYRLKCVWQNSNDTSDAFVIRVVWLPRQRMVEIQILTSIAWWWKPMMNTTMLSVLDAQWKHAIDIAHQLCIMHLPTMALDAKYSIIMSWSIDKKHILDPEPDSTAKPLCTSLTCKTNANTIKQFHEVLAWIHAERCQTKLMNSIHGRPLLFMITADDRLLSTDDSSKVYSEDGAALDATRGCVSKMYSASSAFAGNAVVTHHVCFDPQVDGSALRMWRSKMNLYDSVAKPHHVSSCDSLGSLSTMTPPPALGISSAAASVTLAPAAVHA